MLTFFFLSVGDFSGSFNFGTGRIAVRLSSFTTGSYNNKKKTKLIPCTFDLHKTWKKKI